MNCKCKHSRVCVHRSAIETAIRPIIHIYIPGPHPRQPELDEIVQDICRFRDADDTDFVGSGFPGNLCGENEGEYHEE